MFTFPEAGLVLFMTFHFWVSNMHIETLVLINRVYDILQDDSIFILKKSIPEMYITGL
jgi:hypothetical protein